MILSKHPPHCSPVSTFARSAVSPPRRPRHGSARRWLAALAVLTACAAVPASAAERRDLSSLPAVKAHAGKVVLLDFWASWCAPCRQSFPWMSTLQRRFGREKFAVVAVNMDQDKALAAKFLEKTPGDFQIQYDPKGELASHLDVQAMPTSYLIDRHGRQRAVHKGFRDSQRAPREQEIEQLIREGNTP